MSPLIGHWVLSLVTMSSHWSSCKISRNSITLKIVTDNMGNPKDAITSKSVTDMCNPTDAITSKSASGQPSDTELILQLY